MPIDTANKRSSAVNVGSPWRGLLPFPDGTIGQADRQHAALHYAGILAAGAPPAPAPAPVAAAGGIPLRERDLRDLNRMERLMLEREDEEWLLISR